MLLIQRLWSIAAAADSSQSAVQYQSLSPQYQGPTPPRRARAHAKPVVVPAPEHPGRVLAAVVTRQQRRAKAVVVRASSSEGRAERSRGTPEATVQHREAVGSSGGWLVRALVGLVGVALLSVLLTTTDVRTRLASKGLSSSRIDLGSTAGAPRRRGGIFYRD